jgi:hypothetical protein
MFSNMGLRHTTTRVSRQDNGTASQAQTPAPPQTTAQVQTHASAHTPATSPDNESHPVDMPSESLTTALDESSLPDPMLDVDKTRESPFDESTTTSARIGDEEQITVDAQILPEKPSTSVEIQSELEPGVTSEKTGDPSSSDNGMLVTYHPEYQRLYRYRALRHELFKDTVASGAIVMLREGVMQPISRRRSSVPIPLCLLIAMSRRRARKKLRPPSAVSLLLILRQLDLRDVTDRPAVPEQFEPPTTTRPRSTKTPEAIIDDILKECLVNTRDHVTISRKFDRLVEDLQSFRQTRDTKALKFQNCYSSHSRTKTSLAKCVDCFLRVKDLEDRYLQACASIRKMMEELCECIRASFVRANMHQKIRIRLEAEMSGEIYLYEDNIRRLEDTKRMLQSLEDDAEAAKGWPQVSMSDGPLGNDQAPKNANEGEDAGTDDTKSSQVKSRTGKSKVQKKKKGRR